MKGYNYLKIPQLLLILYFLNLTSILAEEKQGIRLGLFGGSGKFELATGDSLNGLYDHDLKGGSFAISYNRTNENNLFFGGGYQSVGTYSEDWEYGSKKIPGYWTYYSYTYGYFDAAVVVDEFRTNFIYGLVGYEIDINENWLFQPNLKLGQKTYHAKWREYVKFRSYSSTTATYDESTSSFGLEIDLPFMYSFGEVFSLGANLCLCNSSAKFSQGSYEYTFTSNKIINLLLDWRI
jgi:hypothetical protein